MQSLTILVEPFDVFVCRNLPLEKNQCNHAQGLSQPHVVGCIRGSVFTSANVGYSVSHASTDRDHLGVGLHIHLI